MPDLEWGKKREYTPDEAREFWEQARARVKSGDCNFRFEIIPKDPDKLGFKRIIFGVDADFSEATFVGDANFNEAEFVGDADFSEAEFTGDAGFYWAKFGGNALFWDTSFRGETSFIKTKFHGRVIFSHAEFAGKTNFLGVEFVREADFTQAVFSGEVDFFHVEFGGNTDFRACRFLQQATFKEAVSRDLFRIDLPSPWWKLKSWRRRPFALLGQGYEAYRMAKQSAANRGDYPLAGKFHYAEYSTRCTAKLISSWCKMFQQSCLRRRFKAVWRCLCKVAGRVASWQWVGTVWRLCMAVRRCLYKVDRRVASWQWVALVWQLCKAIWRCLCKVPGLLWALVTCSPKTGPS